MDNKIQMKKTRILCLHGFRTSGVILQKLVERWPQPLLQKLDLVFMDAPFPARGKSDLDGIFEPPFYEWFQSDEEFKEFYNFEECLAKIEEFMLNNGPFDGVLGFSQGAILTAAIPGMQREGVALTKVPTVKCVIIISGAKFGGLKFGMPELAAASFSTPITTPSLHLIVLLITNEILMGVKMAVKRFKYKINKVNALQGQTKSKENQQGWII